MIHVYHSRRVETRIAFCSEAPAELEFSPTTGSFIVLFNPIRHAGTRLLRQLGHGLVTNDRETNIMTALAIIAIHRRLGNLQARLRRESGEMSAMRSQ
jgi:hypothetical protein